MLTHLSQEVVIGRLGFSRITLHMHVSNSVFIESRGYLRLALPTCDKYHRFKLVTALRSRRTIEGVVMLTEAQRSIIRATVPALQNHGEAITQHFYKTLFSSHPELLNIFNKANQRPGGQSANLATSILMYAANIDQLDKLSGMVERIAHKHGSMEVKPEHYPVVGHHLLESIRAVLGEAATDEVLDAWGAAYGDLAAIFIRREKELYDTGARRAGGWYGFKEFLVSQKVRESATIVSFHLVPTDGRMLPDFLPGQFLSVKLKAPQDPNEQIRQYSLSCASNGTYYRISVGREKSGSNNILVPDGIVSNFLQDQVEQGDILQVHMPLGDFVLDERSSRPVVLLSGGVGITPVLAMFHYLVTHSDRPVTFLHGTGSRLEHSFSQETRDLASTRSNTKAVVFYTEVNETDIKGEHHDESGFIDADMIRRYVPDLDADYYVCGPVPILRAIEAALDSLQVPRNRQHSEAFAPDPTLLMERDTGVAA